MTGVTGDGSPGRRASSFLYGYWADFPSDGYEWFYRPGLTAGAIPTNAGLTCVFIGAPPARLQQLVNERSPLFAFHSLADPVGIGQRIGGATRAEPVRYIRALPPGYLRAALRAGLGAGRGRRSLDRPDEHPRHDVGVPGCRTARPGGAVAHPGAVPISCRRWRTTRPPATGCPPR